MQNGKKNTSPCEDFIFVEGTTVIGSSDYDNSEYNKFSTGVFPDGKTVAIGAFYMCEHEVTQNEYERYCCYTTSEPSSSYGLGYNYPAYYISWYDAIVYCNLRSIAEGRTPCYTLNEETDPRNWEGINANNGKYSCSYTSSNTTWDSINCNFDANGYRLPTEVEWEFAARGGNETYGTDKFAYYFAGVTTTNYKQWSNSALDSVGWYADNTGNNGITGITTKTNYRGSHEIKKKNANALNLYDMSGNISEWCWDWHSNKEVSFCRVHRGGDCGSAAIVCAVSYQAGSTPYYCYWNIGFRVICSDIGDVEGE